MKRLSKNAMVVTSREMMKHGWGFEAQVARNPQSRKLFKDRREVTLRAKLRTRARQWSKRAEEQGKPIHYRRAARALAKAGEHHG